MKRESLDNLSPKQIIQIIQEAGIVGMGGAGFPTHVKLSPKEPEKIEYIIANCSECEPYLTSDYRRMIENPEMVVGGVRAVLKIFPQARGVIAVEDNKKDAAETLRRTDQPEDDIEVMELKTKYPQGAERHLFMQSLAEQSIPLCFRQMQDVLSTTAIRSVLSTVQCMKDAL